MAEMGLKRQIFDEENSSPGRRVLVSLISDCHFGLKAANIFTGKVMRICRGKRKEASPPNCCKKNAGRGRIEERTKTEEIEWIELQGPDREEGKTEGDEKPARIILDPSCEAPTLWMLSLWAPQRGDEH
jgi:hypothetical protein